MSNKLARRDLMRGGAVAVAAIPLAAFRAQASGENARDLWRRYLDGVIDSNTAQNDLDGASHEARLEIEQMDVPWRFEAVIEPHALVGPKADCWRCYEVRRVDLANERRVTVYPEARSIEQAAQTSKAALAERQASYDKAVAKIKRKHRVAAFEATAEKVRNHAWDTLHSEIVNAPIHGPADLALKLGLYMIGTEVIYVEKDSGDMAGREEIGLWAVYRTLVEQGGFDPVEQYQTTPGV